MLPVLLETRSAESTRRKSATPGAAICSQVLLEGLGVSRSEPE